MSDKHLVDVVALVNQHQPALVAKDRARVNDIIAQLVEHRAPMGGQWQQLAYIALGNGEVTLARKAMDILVEVSGGGPRALFDKANFLALAGHWRDADALLRELAETVPDPVTNAYSRGTAALNLGNREDARRHLEKVTQLQPQSGFGWFTLSTTVNFAKEPALAQSLIAAESVVERAPLVDHTLPSAFRCHCCSSACLNWAPVRDVVHRLFTKGRTALAWA